MVTGICKHCKKTIYYKENGNSLRSILEWVHKNGFRTCGDHFVWSPYKKYSRKEKYAEPMSEIQLRALKLDRVL